VNSRYKIRGLEWVGATVGSLIYFDSDDNGDVVGVLLQMPSDWETQRDAGTPYILVGLGIPQWRALAVDTVITSGYGNQYGNDFGGPDL
jgi:hypothetical protein